MHFNSIDEGLFKTKRTVFFGPFKLRKRVKRRRLECGSTKRAEGERGVEPRSKNSQRPEVHSAQGQSLVLMSHRTAKLQMDCKPWQRRARPPPPLRWLRPCRSWKPLSPKFFTTNDFFFFCCMNYASLQGNGADYFETDVCQGPCCRCFVSQFLSKWIFLRCIYFGLLYNVCRRFFFVDVAVKKKVPIVKARPLSDLALPAALRKFGVFLQIHTGVFTIMI